MDWAPGIDFMCDRSGKLGWAEKAPHLPQPFCRELYVGDSSYSFRGFGQFGTRFCADECQFVASLDFRGCSFLGPAVPGIALVIPAAEPPYGCIFGNDMGLPGTPPLALAALLCPVSGHRHCDRSDSSQYRAVGTRVDLDGRAGHPGGMARLCADPGPFRMVARRVTPRGRGSTG